MAAKAISEFPVGRLEIVLADITQEVKMADKIGRMGKDLGHGFTKADAHIVDASPGGSIGPLEISEEGGKVARALARHLHSGQNDGTQAIESCHQGRGIALVCSVQVEDIATGPCHLLANPWCCLAMSHGEKGDELPPQVLYLRGAQSHTSGTQFAADLLCAAMP